MDVGKAKKRQIPAVEGLFTWPSEEPSLIATKCRSCGTCSFPKTFTCRNPNCAEKDVEEVFLSRRGRLNSYTIMHFPPPPPFKASEPFVPFGIGLVELSEGILVTGILTEDTDLKALKLGMEMELQIGKLYEEGDNEVMGWKFRAVRSSQALGGES